MKKLFIAAIASIALSSGAFAQVPITNVITNAFDFASNYTGGWTNGSDAGFGFGAWTFSTAGNAGTFTGDPSSGGIGGMSSTSFGLYANSNPPDNANFVNASRTIDSALAVGQTFSFQWGINWDSDGIGNKGFNLLSGTNQIVNINNGGPGSGVTINGAPTGLAFGTNSFYIGFTRLDATTYTVFSSSSRVNASGGGFSTNISSSLAADNFQLYASGLAGGDQRQPYYNDFSVTAVPEPSTYALLALSAAAFGGYVIRRRRR